jgi:adenylate cyclase
MRASPHDPLNWFATFWIGLFQYFMGQFAESAETMRLVSRIPPSHAGGEVRHYPYRWLGQALGQLGRVDEARAELERAMTCSPAFFDRFVRQRPPWMRQEDYALAIEGLRKAEWKG